MRRTITKALIAVALWISTATVMCGQIAVRSDVGFQMYRERCDDPMLRMSYPGVGVHLGTEYDIRMNRHFYLTPGLYWSYRYVKSELIYVTERTRENLLNVPILAKYRFDIKPKRFGMYFYSGPTFGLCVSSRSRISVRVRKTNYYEYYMLKGTYDYIDRNFDPDNEDNKLDSALKKELDENGPLRNRFEMRLDSGVGFVIKENFELVAGFDYCFTDWYKSGSTGLSTQANSNSSSSGECSMTSYLWYLGFRYRFPLK